MTGPSGLRRCGVACDAGEWRGEVPRVEMSDGEWRRLEERDGEAEVMLNKAQCDVAACSRRVARDDLMMTDYAFLA